MVFEHIHIEGSTVKRVSECRLDGFWTHSHRRFNSQTGIRVYGWMVFEHIHIEGSTVKWVSECMVGWKLNTST